MSDYCNNFVGNNNTSSRRNNTIESTRSDSENNSSPNFGFDTDQTHDSPNINSSDTCSDVQSPYSPLLINSQLSQSLPLTNIGSTETTETNFYGSVNLPLYFSLQTTDVKHYTEIYEQVFMYLIYPFLGYLQNAFLNNMHSYYVLLNAYKAPTVNSGMYAIQCISYCKLALGAYFCKKFKHSKEFIDNARASIGEILDQLDSYHNVCAVICIIYYYLSIGEICKIMPYESLLSEACEKLSCFNLGKHSNDIKKFKYAIYYAKSFYPYTKELEFNERLNVAKNLYEIDYPMATILSTCIANGAIIDLSNIQDLYRIRITVSEDTKSYLTNRSYCFTQHMYLYFNSYLDAQLAVFYFLLREQHKAFLYATQCIQQIQILAQLQKNYLMWWQINILECVTKIHLSGKLVSELVEILESLTNLPENGLKLKYKLTKESKLQY